MTPSEKFVDRLSLDHLRKNSIIFIERYKVSGLRLRSCLQWSCAPQAEAADKTRLLPHALARCAVSSEPIVCLE